jgi:hypothetical protein
MAKFHVNDVRASSANPAYQGVVFSGPMKAAIKQAKKAPDHGIPQMPSAYYCSGSKWVRRVSRDRFNLLQFLNLTKPAAVGYDSGQDPVECRYCGDSSPA